MSMKENDAAGTETSQLYHFYLYIGRGNWHRQPEYVTCNSVSIRLEAPLCSSGRAVKGISTFLLVRSMAVSLMGFYICISRAHLIHEARP